MRSLIQVIKEGTGPYATELTGDPVEDGYVVLANMLNENYKSESIEPEFKNGVLALKVLKGDYNDDYIGLSDSFENTFDKAVKKFGVKRISITGTPSVKKVFLPELVDGVDIEAPDYYVAFMVSAGFKGTATISNSSIECQNFFADHNGKVLFDKANIECVDNFFKIHSTNTLGCIKPNCRITADVLGVANAKATLLKKLEDMKKETDPSAFSNLDIAKITGLKADGPWDKVVINLTRWHGSAVFTRNGAAVMGDHGPVFKLKDEWSLTFCDNTADSPR